jgi:CheY-like chemotaxis protein
MSPEVLTQAFEPFFTTKEEGRGTGLGLSTVYGIVRQSGGNIWVSSEQGRGTSVKVHLPRAGSRPMPAPARLDTTGRAGGSEHVLVVEDEQHLRELMASILSRLGYRATLASNGGEALLLVEERGLEPDLIITDAVMPNMSGIDLIRRLKRGRPRLKAICMSGYADEAVMRHGVLDPDTPFIHKPFSISEIASKIREVLAGEEDQASV